jgi:Flagellar motor protein
MQEQGSEHMAKKRRAAPEESGGGYSWMDTYGDLVTLLLCFFVLLYSFSSMDAQKAKQLVGAFNGNSSPSAIESLNVSDVKKDPIQAIDDMVDYKNRSSNVQNKGTTQESFDQLYQNIKQYIESNGLEGQLSVEKSETTIILRFGEVFLFNSGKADLLPSGQAALLNIIKIVSQNSSAIKLITIEGNTDNVPIRNSEFKDNWDLSVTRAVNVLRTVQGYNIIDPSKLAAVGYGEYQPIDTNTTDAGRAHNRRVDFVIQKMPEDNASSSTGNSGNSGN